MIYAGLAAVFVAVMIYMFFYTRRMRNLGNKNQTSGQDTTSEIVSELRADGTTVDAPTGTKEQK